jgi:hypothetical protein
VLKQSHGKKIEAAALRSIYMISVAFKKLRGDYDKNILKQQFEDFVATDAALAEIDLFNSDIFPIVEFARAEWKQFARDITLEHRECRPRPGPGATANSVPKSMRYAPRVIFKQLDKVFPTDLWFYSHPWDVVEKSRDYVKLLNSQRDEPFSEFLYVPKTAGKPRGICKEWNEMQYHQQAIRNLLAHFIRSAYEEWLPLEDQTVHGIKALHASDTREDATIDESEASDRILRDLVSWISQDNQILHDALMAVSTKWIKPPSCMGKKAPLLRTHKFAPMGSGVCFPVMSLVHLFLIRGIICTKMTDITPLERTILSKRVSVYGDDIILPSECVSLVYQWLPYFGMKINQDKSYYKSYFRESCGTHAYKGVEVTPVYVKYTTPSTADDIDEKSLVSLLKNESDLFKRGFHFTAQFLRRTLNAKWKKTNLPYVSEDTALLGFLRPSTFPLLTNFKTGQYRKRWDDATQSFWYRVPVMQTRSESCPIKDPMQAYLAYQCVHSVNPVSIREVVQPLFSKLAYVITAMAGFVPVIGPTAPKEIVHWSAIDHVEGLKAIRMFLPESSLIAAKVAIKITNR